MPQHRLKIVVLGVVILAVVAIGTLLALRAFGVLRPPRPMFANEFSSHPERPSLPIWRTCEPLVDRHGTWIWGDFGDNVLAVHMTGNEDLTRIGPIVPAVDHTRFRKGEYPSEEWVVVPRTRDELIVISPRGQTMRFSLPGGSAERFYSSQLADPTIWSAGTVLIDRVGSVLTPTQRAELSQFLAGAPSTEH